MSTAIEHRILAVMARPPVAGRVKSRLAADVGAGAAATIYRRLLDGTLAAAERLDATELVVALADGADGDGWAPPRRWRVVSQRGPDLGARLAALFDDLFAMGGEQVALVDSDSPDLPVAYLRDAFAALGRDADVVLGPTTDGGFYLIAVRASTWRARGDDLSTALSAAALGTARALATAARGVAGLGLSVHELPLWVDVDEAGDLPLMERLLGDGGGLRGLPLESLREIYLHVTNRCARSCLHCYNRANLRATDELTTAEWREAIDQCVELGAGSFVFLGGDPFLRADLLELIAHVTGRRGAKARLFFNRSLDEVAAAELADAGHGRLRPLVSVDGTAEVNDGLRGVGDHEDVMTTIVELVAAGLRPVANTVVLRPVLPTLPELARELAGAGVGRLHLIFPHHRGGLNERPELIPTGTEMLTALHELRDACDDVGMVLDNVTAWRRRLAGRQDFCTAGCRDLAIDPYGCVHACTITCGDPAFVAGRLRGNGLEEIWRGSPALRLLRAARARDRDDCRACPVVDACGGECWMQAHYAARADGRPAGWRAAFPYCDLVRPVLEGLRGEAAAGGACGGQAAACADLTLFDCI